MEEFIARIENFEKLKSAEQLEYFLYFLTCEKKTGGTANYINECFFLARLNAYSNVSAYLISNLKGRGKMPPKFLKQGNGYLLHRSLQDRISQIVSTNLHKVKVSKVLRDLLAEVKDNIENNFLQEAIDCFEIGAYRASIVMVWNLTIDHLYQYILNTSKLQFDLTLSKNNDKRIKVSQISTRDDFSDIPEVKFIELCRSANIISNDIRKILDTKLGIRNTFAHPSNVKIVESKAIEFIDDLVTNVILKYPLK